MRKSCPATMKKRQKHRYLLGKAGVTPDKGAETLSFIDNRIISSLKVAGDRLADSKNDLSKSAGIIEKFDIFFHIGSTQNHPESKQQKQQKQPIQHHNQLMQTCHRFIFRCAKDLNNAN